MALKGQGDPRWIVESRADGANVNAWHWTETDLSEWAKDKLKQLLAGIPIESDKFVGGTTTVTHVDGDVTVNTRKQKTIVLYELDVTVKWEGQLTSSRRATAPSTCRTSATSATPTTSRYA
jgi:activator of HSP90 ATPase